MPIEFGPLSGYDAEDSALAAAIVRVFAVDGAAANSGAAHLLAVYRMAASDESVGIVDVSVPDSLGASATLVTGGSDASFTADGSGMRFYSGLSGFDALPGHDVAELEFRATVVGLEEEPIEAYAFYVEQPGQIIAYAGIVYEQMEDVLLADDTPKSTMIMVARAILALHDLPAPHADALAAAMDVLALDDALAAVLLELMADGLALSDTETLTYQMVQLAVSRLLVTGQAKGIADAKQTVTSALLLGFALNQFLMTQSTDVLALDDIIAHTAVYLQSLLDELAVADNVASVWTGLALVADDVAFNDTAATSAQTAQLLRDSLALSMSLTLDNGQYVAWLVNTDTAGVSTYDNYPFNSFAKIGGRYYGATSTGLFLLEGNDDNTSGIDARLRLGMNHMGSRVEKSFSEVYIGYTGDGQLLLRTILTDDGSGQKVAAEYRMKARPAASRRESRFEPGKGLRAVYFDFEIENINGSDFDLSSVEFQPMLSNRRTRG